MNRNRVAQVWMARQYEKNRPWQRARQARRLREAERRNAMMKSIENSENNENKSIDREESQ